MSPISHPSRRTVLGGIFGTAVIMGFLKDSNSIAADDPGLVGRFKDLSQNGNSTCSAKFTESIATMPSTSRIKGSCCSPMEMKRYVEQVNGLARYRDIAMIPSDPYDIPAGVAQKMMPYYDVKLTAPNSRPTTMRWQIPRRRVRAAANAGAGKCMAVWRNT
jgi:hypothetical protein